MQSDSTTGPGNLHKAGVGTTRYLVTFTLVRDGTAEDRQHAWRAPNEREAIKKVKQFYEKEPGVIFNVTGATEILGSYKD
jgi:hypothetical protein